MLLASTRRGRKVASRHRSRACEISVPVGLAAAQETKWVRLAPLAASRGDRRTLVFTRRGQRQFGLRRVM